MAAGPIANFILAIVIFASVFMFVGVPMNEPRVENVIAGSAAEKAGIKRGDLFTAVDGQKIETFSDLQQAIWTRGGEQLTVAIDRQGTLLNLQLVPDIKTESDGFGGTIKIGLLGVQRARRQRRFKVQRLSPLAAIAKVPMNMAHHLDHLQISGKLIAEKRKFKSDWRSYSMQKGRPMRPPWGPAIRNLCRFSVGQCWAHKPVSNPNAGWRASGLLRHETVLGKPLGQQDQEWGFRVGLSLVVMLMAFGFWNDLTGFCDGRGELK